MRVKYKQDAPYYKRRMTQQKSQLATTHIIQQWRENLLYLSEAVSSNCIVHIVIAAVTQS